ncbi:endo alpha-1,4 polygalactosaminidase [Longispora albida]|uniref:endo alpha-1,4 polygalactosaminidase n=1 Tax=Longispora albida TaxID=203523 RepID=UPI0003A6B2DB|nr:endo alpha-1,4 polygalactosaminidase [Longispora albida]
MRRIVVLLLVLGLAACTPAPGAPITRDTPPGASPSGSTPGPGTPGATVPPTGRPDHRKVRNWLYQLQNYPGGKLDALAKTPADLVVIDLARDARSGFFTADEIRSLKGSGKTVLAYFEIGSIEDFRPEYASVKDLILNQWADWPEEYFVRYWEPSWWDKVVGPRLDQAAEAGFDGVYLDTPLAYEEIDLSLVRGESRDSLGRKMAALISRISRYDEKLLIFPQNSPELRKFPGYTEAIDGIGMEELFYLATDVPCTQDFCGENLAETRELARQGKTVLAVDYATRKENARKACERYAAEGFAGYVTTRDLDKITQSCQ